MKRFFGDGSYTVEAAFLIPMILGIMYAWMFQLFYLRDQVVMNGLLGDMAIQAQMDRGKEEEEYDGAPNPQEIQSYLWLAKISLLKRQQDTLQIRYQLKASACWNIPVMEQFLGRYFSSSLTKKVDNLHPETVLRLRGKDVE